MKTLSKIKLSAPKEKELIYNSSLFYYIDSDFKKYHLTTDDEKNTHTAFVVKEIEKNGTFKDFFTDLENMWMTQEQVLDIVKII